MLSKRTLFHKVVKEAVSVFAARCSDYNLVLQCLVVQDMHITIIVYIISVELVELNTILLSSSVPLDTEKFLTKRGAVPNC